MNKIKQLRKEKKLTQKELAEKTDIPYRTLQRWENGETDIKSDKAEKLANFFGVSIAHLLGYEDNDFKNETDLKVSVLDEALKKLHAIMVLAESSESPNLVEFGIGTAIAEVESFKREIENGDK